MKNKRSAKQWLEYISPVIESSPSLVDERTSMKNEKNDMQWLEYISPFVETSPSRVISPFTETSDLISPTNEAVETMTKKQRTNIKRRPKRNKKEIRRETSCDTQRVKTNDVESGKAQIDQHHDSGVVDWLRSVIAWTGSLMSKVWEALGCLGRDTLNREDVGKP
jgi:hypothetical protein